MRRILPLAMMAAILALLMPALADPPEKPDKPEADEKQKADVREKLLAAPYLLGRLTKVDAGESAFTLQVLNYLRISDPEGTKNFNDLRAKYRVAAAQKNQDEMQKLAEQIKEAQAKLYVEVRTDFELKGAEDIKVRSYKPLAEEGKTGRDNLGFIVAAKDLGPDMWVRVSFDRGRYNAAREDGTLGETGPYPLATINVIPGPGEQQPGQPGQPGQQAMTPPPGVPFEFAPPQPPPEVQKNPPQKKEKKKKKKK